MRRRPASARRPAGRRGAPTPRRSQSGDIRRRRLPPPGRAGTATRAVDGARSTSRAFSGEERHGARGRATGRARRPAAGAGAERGDGRRSTDDPESRRSRGPTDPAPAEARRARAASRGTVSSWSRWMWPPARRPMVIPPSRRSSPGAGEWTAGIHGSSVCAVGPSGGARGVPMHGIRSVPGEQVGRGACPHRRCRFPTPGRRPVQLPSDYARTEIHPFDPIFGFRPSQPDIDPGLARRADGSRPPAGCRVGGRVDPLALLQGGDPFRRPRGRPRRNR